MSKFFIAFLMTLLGCGSVAQAQPGKTWFMPKNQLHLEDRQQVSNITEQEFNGVLDIIEQTYAPIFEKFGAELNLERDWQDSTVNAWADQNGRIWTVHMYGGMARRSELNAVGFGLVACHEIGHHLAGWPLWELGSWAANEGNSDYFANFVCARKVFSAYPVPAASGTMKSKCDGAWTEQADRDGCYRSLEGGLGLAKLLANAGGGATPSLDTPDPSKVSKTKPEHPKAQCRLDTYLAGSVCAMGWNDTAIPTKDGSTCNNRPRCWFKSETDDPTDPSDPKPEPSGNGLRTIELINEFRESYWRKPVEPSPEMQCMSDLHANDIGPSQKCSHVGTNGSKIKDRKKICGLAVNDYTMQIVACKRPSPESAMEAWRNSRENFYAILTPYYKTIGCSENNGMYVCVFSIK
jgi:uncharacterized protein YkwD